MVVIWSLAPQVQRLAKWGYTQNTDGVVGGRIVSLGQCPDTGCIVSLHGNVVVQWDPFEAPKKRGTTSFLGFPGIH